MTFVGASAAFASDTDLDRLVQLNPGSTSASIDAAAAKAASQSGLTKSAVLSKMLMKSEQSALQASGGISPMSSSSGGGTVYLGAASAKGDVFVSPSSTLFIEHGHTGIYYSKTVVVEAPGGNVKSRSIAASALRVGKGAVKQSVTVSTAKRDASANYAYNKLRSKAYNSNFAVNRDAYGRDMNCSQLVWAAFKIGASIDIDSDGGFGVYPYNIKDSKYTTT